MKDNGKALYILIGFVAILLSYFLIFNNFKQKNAELQETVDELQSNYDRLKADYVNKDTYIKETKEFDKKYEEILSKFDTTLLNEGQLMDIYNMQGNCGVQVTAVTLSEPLETYAFDGSMVSDNPAAAQTQQPATNPDGTPIESDSITTTTAIDSSYKGISNDLSLTAEGNYEGIKSMLKSITEDKKRKVPTSISFVYDSTTEQIVCSVKISEYAIKGNDRKQSEVDIPNGAIGRENIFFDPLGTISQTP